MFFVVVIFITTQSTVRINGFANVVPARWAGNFVNYT